MPIGGGGARIKSIQRGVIQLNGVTSNTAAITAVDTTKAELRLLGCQCNTAATALSDLSTYLTLTNATTVTATRLSSTGIVFVSFEVTEWY